MLDVGSRDGRHLVELHDRFDCRVTGVEPAPGNLARMRRTFGARPLTVTRGVVEALPFASSSFDLIWIRDVLVHVEPLTEAFRECRRVLRRGHPMVVLHVLATPALEASDAERLCAPAAIVPASIDQQAFERALRSSGFVVERREDLTSEWSERSEERDGKVSRQLLRIARMTREPAHYQRLIGKQAFAVELGNCLFSVYQLLGKLTAVVYVVR